MPSSVDIGTFSERRNALCITAFAQSLSVILSATVGLGLTCLMPRGESLLWSTASDAHYNHYTTVLSIKGSVDITLSHDGTELPEKKAEEIQMVTTCMLIDTNYYSNCCYYLNYLNS